MAASPYNPTYGGAGGGGGGGYQTGNGIGNSLSNNKALASTADPLGAAGMLGGTWWDPANLFGTVRPPNPADAGMGYLDQVPGTISPYYQPYIDAGQQSLSTLMGQYNNLLNDPGAVMNNAAKGFNQSPGYQFQYNQAMNASNGAAAAGGFLGTSNHQGDASARASNLANQDYYNYMGNALNMYNTGLSGMGGINQMGYGASNELAQSLAANLQSQAGMAYKGQENANENQAGITAGIAKMGGSLLGAFSDIRLKENIKKVGERNGFNIYQFNYKNYPDRSYEGVMAQEVLDIKPEAVHEEDGYLYVDYGLLGLEMREIKNANPTN